MVKVCEICPLAFNPIRYDQNKSYCYIQKFYTTDNILVQVISDGDIPEFVLHDVSKDPYYTLLTDENSLILTDENGNLLADSYNDNVTVLTPTVSTINTTYKLYYISLTGLTDSIYKLTIGDLESEPFEVTSSDLVLESTSLIRCTNDDNDSSFDNRFWIGSTRQFIEFRVECGIKPSGVTQNIENEYFRNQYQEIKQLYSMPYSSYTLTVGDAIGVPYWVGELLNKMLSVDTLFIDNDSFVRSENNVPEATQVSETDQLFWFNQMLEKADNLSGVISLLSLSVEYETASYSWDGSSVSFTYTGHTYSDGYFYVGFDLAINTDIGSNWNAYGIYGATVDKSSGDTDSDHVTVKVPANITGMYALNITTTTSSSGISCSNRIFVTKSDRIN